MYQVKEAGRSAKWEPPAWREVLTCFAVYAVIAFAGAVLIYAVVPSGTVFEGLCLSVLSALGGCGAFYAAYLVRPYAKADYNLCRVSKKWLFVAAGLGVGVYVLAGICSVLYLAAGGAFLNVQQPVQMAASGSTASFVMQLFLSAVAMPIGEELAFRAILTNALLRLHPPACMLLSSFAFALAHGFNETFIAAFITGLAASYLFCRTRSIWPCVVMHAVKNLLGVLALALIPLLL